MAEDRDDVVFFSVTEEHKVLLRELAETLFETEGAAFAACVSLAIQNDLPPVPFSKGKTTWNATTMSYLVDFLTWHQKTKTPIRLANELGYAGLNFYEESVKRGEDPKEIFFSVSAEDSSEI
jgi:hypothetical protein